MFKDFFSYGDSKFYQIVSQDEPSQCVMGRTSYKLLCNRIMTQRYALLNAVHDIYVSCTRKGSAEQV